MTAIKTIPSKKRSKRKLAATVQPTIITTGVYRNASQKAVTCVELLGSLGNEGLVDLHAGNKFRRDGFDRRLQSRKTYKRDIARVLDFALYPVTGTPTQPVSYKLVKSNNVYVDLHNKEAVRDREDLQEELNDLLANRPRHFTFGEERNSLGEMVLVERANLSAVTDWELRVKSLRARIQDKPMATILSSAKTLCELDVNGDVVRVKQPRSLNPTCTPANGRMLRPAFNKIEPLEIGSMLTIKSCVSDPLRKAANSHLKEVPLKLALWMICKQEGLDAVKLYGMTDSQAQAMLDKLHERN